MEDLERKLTETDDIYYYVKQVVKNNKDLSVNFNSKKKGHLFALGLSFADSKVVSKINLEDLKIDGPKSFDKMLYIWWKNHLKPVLTQMNYNNRAFLICPVRKADEEQKQQIMNFVNDTEKSGTKVHYPERDTDQDDTYGYRICLDNANAISNAKHVYLYYDRDSTGTFFDLGVAYYLQMEYPDRTFTIINEKELELDPKDMGDKIILSMLNMQKLYQEQKDVRKR